MKIDLNEKLTTNFTLREALWLPQWSIHAVPDEPTLISIHKTAGKLQEIRDHFGKPIRIHCWWRPIEYNKLVKGAKNSAHIYGQAVDFSIDGLDCLEVKLELEKMLEELQIRLEENGDHADWVHIDTRWTPGGNNFFKP